MLIYDLEHTSFLLKSQANESVLLNLDNDVAYKGTDWVRDHKSPCSNDQCHHQLSILKTMINKARDNDEIP